MSLIEWSRHSIIFGDEVVHFPNDDLALLFWPKLLSSVCPRDLATECFFVDIVPYEKHFVRRHKVCGFAVHVSRLHLSAYRTRGIFFALRAFSPEPLTWIPVNKYRKKDQSDQVGFSCSAHRMKAKQKSFSHVESLRVAELKTAAFT